jgi:hypothetical protein
MLRQRLWPQKQNYREHAKLRGFRFERSQEMKKEAQLQRRKLRRSSEAPSELLD